MATVANLNKSITEMDTEEATRLIWEVRDRRSTQKAISAKTKKKKAVLINNVEKKKPKKQKMLDLIGQLSPEQLKQLASILKGSD